MQHYHAILTAPFSSAKLGIRMQGAALCALDFVAPEIDDLPAENSDVANVAQQLRRYFSDPAYVFSMPLACTGTPFQQRVWQALREVPAGQPCRYGDLARRLSSGARAVGGACRANPVPIVVPCHRVVSATGLGGYSGVPQGFSPEVASGILPLVTLAEPFAGALPCAALAIKRWLLDHERG